MRIQRGQQGQSLAIALVGIMLAACCFTLLAKVGRMTLERQRADNAADAMALGVAVDYARALNIISLTNKLYGMTEITEIMKKIPYTAPFVQWVPKPKNIQRLQDYMAGTGNGLGYGSAKLSLAMLGELGGLSLASANHLQAVVLWNGEGDEQPSLVPALNLRRRYSGDQQRQDQQGQGNSDKDGKQDKDSYSYKDKDTGQTVEVDSRYVRKETYTRSNGKRQTVYRYEHGKGSSRFVSKKSQESGKALDIAETGPHTVTVVGLRQNSEGGLPYYVCAKAEAGGGSMSLWDINAADYQAYLIPCSEGKSNKWDPANWKLPQTGLAPLDSLLSSLTGPAMDAIRSKWPSDLQVLH